MEPPDIDGPCQQRQPSDLNGGHRDAYRIGFGAAGHIGQTNPGRGGPKLGEQRQFDPTVDREFPAGCRQRGFCNQRLEAVQIDKQRHQTCADDADDEDRQKTVNEETKALHGVTNLS